MDHCQQINTNLLKEKTHGSFFINKDQNLVIVIEANGINYVVNTIRLELEKQDCIVSNKEIYEGKHGVLHGPLSLIQTKETTPA